MGALQTPDVFDSYYFIYREFLWDLLFCPPRQFNMALLAVGYHTAIKWLINGLEIAIRVTKLDGFGLT
jgi:hypothetical protein